MTRPTTLVFPSAERSTLPFAARLLAVMALAAPLAAGCTTEPAAEQDPSTGQIVMPLIQSGSHGELYHLANATFDVTGTTNGVVRTVEGSGSDSEIDLEVPPGVYLIQLRDGWTLEKSIDGGATFEPVSALLGSSNPQNLRVLANQPLTVEFDFVIRSATGTLKLMLGVDAAPRELAGGFVVSSADGDLAAYATANTDLDFAVFFHPSFVGTATLADGTKQRLYQGGAVGASGPFPPFFSPVAMEIYGDRLGLLQPIASGLSGAFIQYTVDATPDGQFMLQGSIEGRSTAIFFGPHPITAIRPTLDADGFPSDVFFYDSELPFVLSRTAGTISGTLRMRHILPSEL
jgi:hypothetical protein